MSAPPEAVPPASAVSTTSVSGDPAADATTQVKLSELHMKGSSSSLTQEPSPDGKEEKGGAKDADEQDELEEDVFLAPAPAEPIAAESDFLVRGQTYALFTPDFAVYHWLINLYGLDGCCKTALKCTPTCWEIFENLHFIWR